MRITDVTYMNGLRVITVARRSRRSFWDWLMHRPADETESQYAIQDYQSIGWHHFPSMKTCSVGLDLNLCDAWDEYQLLKQVLGDGEGAIDGE